MAGLFSQRWRGWGSASFVAASLLSTVSFILAPLASGQDAAVDEVDMDEAGSGLNLVFADSDAPGRQVSKAELLELAAVRQQSVYIPYIDAEREAYVLDLVDFIAHVGGQPGDAVLANSYDGYFSVYQPDFIERFNPYLVLAFKGLDPEVMLLEEGPDLGPFYITFDERLEKGSEVLFDPDHKRPFGVNWLRVGNYREMMAPFYEAPLITITRQVERGRDFYINNCMSCHAYGESKLGGHLSNRTAELLAVHAKFNKPYFRQMVRDPSKWIPDVLMPAHPHYTDAQIDAIAAFLEKSQQP